MPNPPPDPDVSGATVPASAAAALPAASAPDAAPPAAADPAAVPPAAAPSAAAPHAEGEEGAPRAAAADPVVVPEAAPEVCEVPPGSKPSIADGIERALDPRHVKVQRIAGWILTAFLSLGLGIGLFIAAVATGGLAASDLLLAAAWLAVTLGIAWLGQRWPAIEHRHCSYRVDGLGLEVRRGVWWKEIVNVRRARVQHTDVGEGPLERRHGLATLVVHTAAAEHPRIEVAGLDRETALAIRDHFLRRDGGDGV